MISSRKLLCLECLLFLIVASGIAYETVEYSPSDKKLYRMYFKNDNGYLSPFHDIPMFHNKDKNELNMIVEIPRDTADKMEIATNEVLNPIKQDIDKHGELRRTSMNYNVNYGAVPQTWENPKEEDRHTGKIGDNDPIDVVEVGRRIAKRGEVIKVKIIGIFALIDDGETDWKLVTIDVNDEHANHINKKEDIETFYPERSIESILQWFENYKGQAKNTIGLEREVKSSDFALEVLDDVHKHWEKLIKNSARTDHEISCDNVSVDGSPYKKPIEQILDSVPQLKGK